MTPRDDLDPLDPDPLDEVLRAATIAAFDIDGFADDPALDRMTQFAAHLCETPMALVTIVEAERQRFLARTGLAASETPRPTSFCAFAMQAAGILEVPDARVDPCFSDNPLVTGDPHIRFYAGAPLVTDEGVPLGALCVIDRTPRDGLTAVQREGLEVLAAAVMRRLGTRRLEHARRAAVDEREARFQLLADAMPQMVWSSGADGLPDYFSARWYAFTGTRDGETDGERWTSVLHPEDVERSAEAWRDAFTTERPYEVEYRMRHVDGDYRWVLARGLPMRGPGGAIVRWIGTCTDIHEQKQAQVERELISQELSHRIKNIFSVIAGLVTFAARSRPGFSDIAADLRERIMALGRAHDFVRPHSSRSRPDGAQNSLHGLLAQLFAPYRGVTGPRVHIGGHDVAIDDRSATPLALLFHELATNAAKYGALSIDQGHVALDIAEAGSEILFTWREIGGPPVARPTGESGFGSKLIELSAVRQLGGAVAREWHAEGLAVTIRLPSASLSRP